MEAAAIRSVNASTSTPACLRAQCGRDPAALPRSVFLTPSAGQHNLRSGQSSANLSISKKPLCVTAAVSSTAAGADLMSSIAGFFKNLIPKGGPEGEREGEKGEEVEVRGRVSVLGGTGKTGKHVVKQLLEQGYAVSVLASSLDRAQEVLEKEMGLKVGEEVEGNKGVRVVKGRVEDSEALRSVMRGSDAVICCLGWTFTPNDPGTSSPQAVDWEGVVEAVKAASEEIGGEASGKVLPILDFSSLSPESPSNGTVTNGAAAQGGSVAKWVRRDDVIMGGKSESSFAAGEGYAVFQGEVRVEGGGFCGTFTKFATPVDASEYDGFLLRVRGDGKRYKINTRGANQVDGPVQYQASFDTVRGRWTDVFIPFSSFQAMNKGTRVSDAGPLETSALAGLVILQSRFQYDGFPNPLSAQGGPFRLEIESVSVERRPRTQFVLLSSAAVERSARAQSPEEREASIPIVKLNPSGVLSWKLSGEDAVRASGLRYTVVRPCGLTDKEEDQSFILESAQGDAITGLISRPETASVCVRALDSPFAADVTFEVRRDDLSKGLPMTQGSWTSLFSRLRPDVPAGLVQYPAVPQSLMEANKE